MSSGIDFHGGQLLGRNLDLNNIQGNFPAIYLPEVGLEDATGIYTEWFGNNWRDLLDLHTHQIAGYPGIFIGEEFLMNGVSVVEAAACGRAIAMEIYQFLHH